MKFVIYISMYLSICLCTCREQWSWSVTCIQMSSYLQWCVREHSVSVAIRMALSHFSLSTQGIKQRKIKVRAFKMRLLSIWKKGRELRVSREDLECCLLLRVSIHLALIMMKKELWVKWNPSKIYSWHYIQSFPLNYF